MSSEATKRMISAYLERSPTSLFLAGMFQSPPENFHTSESVELDIVRSEEDVAIVIQSLTAGYRDNAADIYTNKEFVPPIFKEQGPLNAFDLIKRMAGQNPFANVSFQSNAIARSFALFRKMEAKIRRSIELQCSQVLQTGVLTLTDAAGLALYSLDFQPKATHLVTVSVAWSGAGDPYADISAIAEVIRSDGKLDPNQLIMGINAFDNFIKNATIQPLFDNRRINIGAINPMTEGGTGGGNFRGTVDIGNYKYDVWTYGGRFTDPQTGNSVQYLDPDNVIVKSSASRLDLTFGAIPRIAPPESRALPFMPSRISNVGGGIDMFTNAWITPDGEQLIVGIGARPLAIPTAIDTFGVLDTTP